MIMLHTWDLHHLPSNTYSYLPTYTRQFVPHCFPAVERCLSTIVSTDGFPPLSPKVTACAGGPNALAAISLSRGTLVYSHHALIRIWIPILTGLIHVLALFYRLIYLIKVKVNV